MAQVPDYTQYPPRLINALDEGSFWWCEEIIEPAGAVTDTFLCRDNINSNWYFTKITVDGVFSHATKKNNTSVTTYADARNNYQTLTYGTYEEALG